MLANALELCENKSKQVGLSPNYSYSISSYILVVMLNTRGFFRGVFVTNFKLLVLVRKYFRKNATDIMFYLSNSLFQNDDKKYLADPGEARGCSTNTSVTH